MVVRHGGPILVPESVVSRVLPNTVLKEAGCVCKVPLYKSENTQCKSHMRILRLEKVSIDESCAHRIEVGIFWQTRCQLSKVRVVLKPVVKVPYSF